MNDSKHHGYDDWSERWEKVRAATCGQSEVKALGERVLPKLNGHEQRDYHAYLKGAVYTNYTGRTMEGLIGMVFRKEPAKEIPAAFERIYSDLDLKGNTTAQVSRMVLEEVMQTGGFGLLVEYPQRPADPISRATAETLNLRPYVSCYPRESILDWRMERVNNSMQPTMIKLREMIDVWAADYTCKKVEQIRMLVLEGGYIQRVYQKSEKGEWVQIGGDIIPTLDGRPLAFIPFWAFGPKMNSLDFQPAPLEDLADVNLAHFRTSASYERGCLFTGAPTPVLAGFQLDENQKVVLGSTTAVTTSDPNAKWGYLEFTGQGLGELTNNMKMKEAQMAALGARMLAPEKSGVEAEGTLKMRSNGESSALAGLVNQTSHGMQQVLAFMALWDGLSDNVTYKMNTDYMPQGMGAQEVLAIVKAWQSGAITQKTLFENLQHGEIISESENFNDYKEELTESEPLGMVNESE